MKKIIITTILIIGIAVLIATKFLPSRNSKTGDIEYWETPSSQTYATPEEPEIEHPEPSSESFPNRANLKPTKKDPSSLASIHGAIKYEFSKDVFARLDSILSVEKFDTELTEFLVKEQYIQDFEHIPEAYRQDSVRVRLGSDIEEAEDGVAFLLYVDNAKRFVFCIVEDAEIFEFEADNV